MTANGPDGATVITLAKDLVVSTAPELRQAMKSAIDGGASSLVIDLAKVRIIDSTGLGLLVAAHNTLSKQGGALSVVNTSPDLLGLFKSMRLDQHFNVAGAGGA